jgi:class 3 adenylate cyclase/pimeloyl-ACP methyl ester carboxylesterase
MNVPDVRYTRSGDVAIAYQVVGEGPIDVMFVRGTLADLLAAWDQPLFAKHVARLSAFSRVILFDKRGSGLSDPVRQLPTLEARMDDVRAVLDAVQVEKAVFWSGHEGTRLATLFAATYPERTSALVLYDPTARGAWAPDYPWARKEDEWLRELREIGARWGDRDYLAERGRRYTPSRADDDAFIDWFVWYERRSASPASAVAFHRMTMEGDVRDVLPAVRSPTLVLHRASTTHEAVYVAGRIPGARRIEISGLRDGFIWADERADEIGVTEMRRFLDGLGSTPEPDRVLATIVFTDIVGSTQKAADLGDGAWRELVDRHHSLVRAQIVRNRGEELDTAGDGFFASFDGPGRAIACAAAIARDVQALGLEVRAGVHTGECERMDGKLGGIAVAIGARVAGAANPGEVLVTGTVRDLVAGSGVEFVDRGEHELKGVPGSWRLFSVVPSST